ncbi:MAG: type II toxin-antitoxin system VapC family toxin [Chloroflexi bacterium]|nr:type II toxin-antitoxin system VapC family toxin [Chloroflexota bacterium]
MAKQPRVFDSWALMAFLEDEPAAEQVQALIAEAQDIENGLLVTVINLGEVWYSMARARAAADADQAIKEILGLGFQMVEVDWELANQAAKLKAKHKLAYADCFAAALARQHKLEIVTGDPEFKQLQSHVKIHWLPQN